MSTNANLPSVLKKHVAAVHTSGQLSLVERKLANILLLNAYDNLIQADGGVPEHRIPVPFLHKMLGWEDSKNSAGLKEALTALTTTAVEFNLLGDGVNEKWQIMTLLSEAELAGGVCTYAYPRRLAERLHDPEIFALINVGVQKKFRCGYSLNLYENCVRFKKTGSTGWWELDKFRKIMGADAAMYNDFKRLSSFVIKKSIDEINALSDIVLTAEYRKEGRKVCAVRFLVKENITGGLPSIDDEEIERIKQSEVFLRLRHHGVSQRLALSYIKADAEQARKAIETTEARDREGVIKNTGAYIKKLIEENAELGPSGYEMERIKKQREQSHSEAASTKQVNDEIKHSKSMIRSMDDDSFRKAVREFLSNLADDKKDKAGDFDFVKRKFKSPVINTEFRCFLNQWIKASETKQAALDWS